MSGILGRLDQIPFSLAKKTIRATVKAAVKAEVIGKNESKTILTRSLALYDTAWRTVWSSIPRTIYVGNESTQCVRTSLQPGIQKILLTYTDLVKYAEAFATRLEKRSLNKDFDEQQRKRMIKLAKSLRKGIAKSIAEHQIELAKIPQNTLQCSTLPAAEQGPGPRR